MQEPRPDEAEHQQCRDQQGPRHGGSLGDDRPVRVTGGAASEGTASAPGAAAGRCLAKG
jgi:hypothetical protein